MHKFTHGRCSLVRQPTYRLYDSEAPAQWRCGLVWSNGRLWAGASDSLPLLTVISPRQWSIIEAKGEYIAIRPAGRQVVKMEKQWRQCEWKSFPAPPVTIRRRWYCCKFAAYYQPQNRCFVLRLRLQPRLWVDCNSGASNKQMMKVATMKLRLEF